MVGCERCAADDGRGVRVFIDQDNVQALATERNELKSRMDAAEQEAKRATSGLEIAERELSDMKTRLGAAEEAEEALTREVRA